MESEASKENRYKTSAGTTSDINNETKQLKELVTAHMDLIQQQQEVINQRGKTIKSLKAENNALQCRLQRMERRMSLLKQREEMSHGSNITHSPPPKPGTMSYTEPIVTPTPEKAPKFKKQDASTPTKKWVQQEKEISKPSPFKTAGMSEELNSPMKNRRETHRKRKLLSSSSSCEDESERKYLKTNNLYYVCYYEPDSSEIDLEPRPDIVNNAKSQRQVEVPTYRIKTYTNLYVIEGTEDIEDEDDQHNEKFYKLLQQLGTPPAFTTLRLNTLNVDQQEIVLQLKSELVKQYEDKGSTVPPIVLHPALKDVVVVPSRGPNSKSAEVTKEVIVDLECGMAVLRGADVFVLGIMGAPVDVNTGDLVAVYADLEGQCRKGFKEEYKERKIYVGCGEMQLSRNQIFCSAQVKLRGIGIKMTHPLYEAPSLDEILPDVVFAQNLPSIVCSLVLNPQPGEVIIDMCAAPGGKTNHLASLMQDQGRAIALDKNALKVEKVVKNIKKWGLSCVETYTFDSTKSVEESADTEGAPPYPPASFDRVLLHVPCSALGQRPSSRNRMTLKSLQSYPTYQRRFIEAGVQLLKPDGTLVYSTCTITMEENEKQVKWMLEMYPSLKLVKQEPHLGETGRPCKGLRNEQLDLLQRFDPSSTTSKSKYFTDMDTIGFFIAKFIKQIEG